MKLRIHKGAMKGRSFDIKNDILFIGRAGDNEIQILDPSVSRRHAKLFMIDNRLYIEDLMSRNGTWVNGSLIRPGDRAELKEGLCFSIGDTVLSLDEIPSDMGMVMNYAIDLATVKDKSGINLIYKDRRITNRRNLELIYEISTIFMRYLDLYKICEKIMESLFYCLKRIDSGTILLIDEDSGEVKKIYERTRTGVYNLNLNYSRTIVSRVIREEKAVIMTDTRQEDVDDLSESIEMMGIKSIMCVPLICGSSVRGVIYVHSINEPNGFRKDDLYLFTALSSPAALAIENAMLYSQTKSIGEEPNALCPQRYKDQVNRLLGGLLHDFNNLLMCIQGNSSLILFDMDENNPHYKRLKQIEEYVEKGAEITDKILALMEGSQIRETS